MAAGRRLLRGLSTGLGIGALSLVVFELLLRVYNPIGLPVRGTQIVLPINKRIVFDNPIENSKLDREIRLSYNSIGYRGPDPVPNPDEVYEIFTVGGSTTHSARQSDGIDWPAQLGALLDREFANTWVNNAGLEGHSTFGHRFLLEQDLLARRPDMILFLIGLNDRGREQERIWDVQQKPDEQALIDRLVARSEVLSTALVLWRVRRAERQGLRHFEFELDDLPVVDRSKENPAAAVREMVEKGYVDAYRERVRTLVRLCREAGVEPVLVTQPVLFGDGIDPRTGVEIGERDWGDGVSASLGWATLDAYNRVTLEVAAEEGVFAIDLASRVPRDSGLYYDWVHFTNEGSRVVADQIAAALAPHLRQAPGIVRR
jgi:lysophospholipase L1-like esterase